MCKKCKKYIKNNENPEKNMKNPLKLVDFFCCKFCFNYAMF